MQKTIVIDQSQKNQLKDHAINSEPNESCALLFGRHENEKTIVEEIYFTKNIDESQINFTISNEELLVGYKIAEEKNLEVIGIFHSHPNSQATPSSTDKKFMRSNPVIWIIYSGEEKNFRAYFLESEIIEIPISP